MHERRLSTKVPEQPRARLFRLKLIIQPHTKLHLDDGCTVEFLQLCIMKRDPLIHQTAERTQYLWKASAMTLCSFVVMSGHFKKKTNNQLVTMYEWWEEKKQTGRWLTLYVTRPIIKSSYKLYVITSRSIFCLAHYENVLKRVKLCICVKKIHVYISQWNEHFRQTVNNAENWSGNYPFAHLSCPFRELCRLLVWALTRVTVLWQRLSVSYQSVNDTNNFQTKSSTA